MSKRIQTTIWCAVFFVLVFCCGLAAMHGSERVTAATLDLPKHEYAHSWGQHPPKLGSINVWRKLDGSPESWNED